MKNTKFLLLFVAVLATFMFVSCGDDNGNDPKPPEPPPTGNYYFGTPDGTFWAFSNGTINDAGEVTDLVLRDSLVQVGDASYLGENAKRMKYYSLAPMSTELSETEFFLRENGNQVFVSSNFANVFIPVLDIENTDEKWLKLADGSATQSWNFDTIEITDIPVPNVPADVKITGNIIIRMTKIAPEDVVSEKYGAFETETFSMEIVASGTPTINGFPTFPIEFTLAEIHFYLNFKNGLVGIYSKPLSLNLAGLYTLNLPGFRKTIENSNTPIGLISIED
jgi:hypothetical protein